MLNKPTMNSPFIVSDGEEDNNSETWDFAPVTSYLLDSTEDASPENLDSGVLIVDGQSNNDDADDGADDLSYPDSLPTEIGSLHDEEKQKKRHLFLVALFLLALIPSIACCNLLYDRQNLMQRNHELEQQIVTMQEAAAKAIQETVFKADWLDQDDPSNKVLLADNCWFKAELELGECTNDAKDSLTDTAEQIQNYFAGEDGIFQAGFSAAFFTEASNTVATAAVTVMDTMMSLNKMLDESILQVMEETRDAVQEASLDKHL